MEHKSGLFVMFIQKIFLCNSHKKQEKTTSIFFLMKDYGPISFEELLFTSSNASKKKKKQLCSSLSSFSEACAYYECWPTHDGDPLPAGGHGLCTG